MLGVKSKYAAAIFAAILPFASIAQAQDATHEITITVLSVKALDKADELSGGDFFVRATIAGETFETPVVSKPSFSPAWKLSKKVAAGSQSVKFALIDKDVSVDDPVDINRVANKRDLDFTVDVKSCKISGFAQNYKCGSKIKRAGLENKKAEITFSVAVSKIKK